MSSDSTSFAFADGGLRISLFPTDNSDDYITDDTPMPRAELAGSNVDENVVQTEAVEEQNIPEHPIPSLQEAFAESLLEVTQGTVAKPKLKKLDAKGRRELLISQERDEKPFDAIWRFRPGQSEHELLKLVAQISFGVYLLLNGMANSNVQVVNILQGHIDEVDEFLEVVLEDLNQATDDLTGRIEHLKLPLTNIAVFEELLEDPTYHAEIVSGNKKIEHILSRTNVIMKEWDDDIECGLSCIAAFNSWLADHREGSWRIEQSDLIDVFDAMEGNVDGWLNAFDEMNDRVQDINSLIIRMMTIVAEMEKKAVEVSRKTLIPRGARHGDASSGSSARSSHRSQDSSTHLTSWSGSPETNKSNNASIDGNESDDQVDYPLPEGLPLLPPTRSPPRAKVATSKPTTIKPQIIAVSQILEEHEEHEGKRPRDASPSSASNDKPPLLLQPHTYSPQLSFASQSPPLKNTPTSAWQPKVEPRVKSPSPPPEAGLLARKASLRDRVSKPPQAIHIPPVSVPEAPSHRPFNRLTTQMSTPQLRQSALQRESIHVRESAYSRDSAFVTERDGPSRNQSQYSPASSNFEFARPHGDSHATASPHSDQYQQFYRPVHASPHSPLQQRPYTSAGQDRPNGPAIYHQRNQPSQLGGRSTLSSVSVATYDTRAVTPSSIRTTGTKQLKKKKSAFGWFKKAFSMDEEERAAFEARKTMQHQDRYHDPNTPRFLDGRRIR